MQEQEIRYRRIPRGAMDTEQDVLVPDRLSFPNLDFFAQRKKCHDRGSFFLTVWQYFSLRIYAAQHDIELDENLRAIRPYERFDQVINLAHDPPLVYIRPEVDLLTDELKLGEGVKAPYFF